MILFSFPVNNDLAPSSKYLMRLHDITERFEPLVPHNPRGVDPSMMTMDEYLDRCNPARASVHPDAVSDCVASFAYLTKQNFPHLLRSIRIGGEQFEFRADTVKNIHYAYDQYGMKKLSPDGQYELEDEETTRAWNRQPYRFDVGVFNSENELIGRCYDLNGNMRISVANEYRGQGLGPILTKLARSLEPDKPSGGLTPAGRKNLVRAWREMVRDALTTGRYREKIADGSVTIDEVRRILKSANLHVRPKR